MLVRAIGSGFLLAGRPVQDHLSFQVLAVVQVGAGVMRKFIGFLTQKEQVEGQ